jgi:integrase
MEDSANTEKGGRLGEGKYKIPFTNTAIDNLKIIGELAKGSHGSHIKVRFKDQRGFYLYWSPVKIKKKFYFRFNFNKKKYDLDLGEYIKGSYGCDEALSKLTAIFDKHKEKGKWVTNPLEKPLTQSELIESQKLTIRQVIEKLLEYNFPRKAVEGRLASITARQHSLFLFGFNKRLDLLKFIDDDKGMTTIKLNGVETLQDLWVKYPSGYGIKKLNKASEISLYDNKLSALQIDDLTPGIVERYLEEKQRTYGYKKNILNSLQYMWGFARSTLKAFGHKRPLDPTTVKEGGVELKQPDENKNKGSIYNNIALDVEQSKRFFEVAEKFKEQRPFQILLIKLIANADIRPSECRKLKKSDFNADHILVRREIRKIRSKGLKIQDKLIPITPIIENIINELKYYYTQYPQYRFVPWAFPSSRITPNKLGDTGYCQSDETRIHTVRDTFELIKAELGFVCALKTLRKTFITDTIEAERDLGKSTEEAIEKVSNTTHPGNSQTTKSHYYKPGLSRLIKRANDISKVIQLKKDQS